jgi:hypothetical protein
MALQTALVRTAWQVWRRLHACGWGLVVVCWSECTRYTRWFTQHTVLPVFDSLQGGRRSPSAAEAEAGAGGTASYAVPHLYVLQVSGLHVALCRLHVVLLHCTARSRTSLLVSLGPWRFCAQSPRTFILS